VPHFIERLTNIEKYCTAVFSSLQCSIDAVCVHFFEDNLMVAVATVPLHTQEVRVKSSIWISAVLTVISLVNFLSTFRQAS
jgi:hypothetical protein